MLAIFYLEVRDVVLFETLAWGRGYKAIILATAVVVKLSGPPKLCKADEIGELCLYSHSAADHYWGLDGVSASIFKVRLVTVYRIAN